MTTVLMVLGNYQLVLIKSISRINLITYKNSIDYSFHPTLPVLSSTSGQRKFVEISDDDNEDLFYLNKDNHENSLKLWWVCNDVKND